MRHLFPALLWAGAALWLAALAPIIERLLRRIGLVRPNFRGDRIPVGIGLVILLWSAPMLLLLARFVPEHRAVCLSYLAIICGMGMLGLADDMWGDRCVTGIRGHIRALFVNRTVTTGFAKLALGSLLSILVPHILLGESWPEALLDGAIIALSANALNLLDLRPGRACAVFLAVAAVLLGFAWRARTPLILVLLVIPTFVVYERDARARAMLGDTGSNLLGASLGLTVVLAMPGLAERLAVLALLLGLHIVAERFSISQLIESNALLRRIDAITGQR